MFSTTTTAASTSMPSAMARPPRLIRLADMPTSASAGRWPAPTAAAPRHRDGGADVAEERPSSTSTSTVASISALDTVPTAFSTSCARL
jgi:hypothetical protein